jgi:hypothetical protein
LGDFLAYARNNKQVISYPKTCDMADEDFFHYHKLLILHFYE